MPVFQSVSKIYIGPDHGSELFEKAKRVLIICDPFIVQSNKLGYVTDRLDAMGVSYEVFKDVRPDPGTELIAAGLAVIRQIKPDTLVAFGGGSAIDAGKAMIYFARMQNYIEDCRFIAIPTTSGTGSEVTKFAIITDEDSSRKYSLIDGSLLPEHALLDAQLTLTVPPAITADTGMDVLTHAIEALVSTEANDFTDAAAEKAIRLVHENLLTAYRQPDDLTARQAMHNASCLAGLAFSNAGLGLNHGMAHALGGRFHIPHGRANAVLLPYVIAYNGERFDRIPTGSEPYLKTARLFHTAAAGRGQGRLNMIRIVKSYLRKLHMPETIRELGVAEAEFKENLPAMAEAAVNDSCTRTNPRKCSKEAVEAVYLRAFYGKQ